MMPLEPRHKYSATILSDIISAIGAKMVKLVDEKTAVGVFYSSTEPVGIRDGNRLMKILGIKRGKNAATGVFVTSMTARSLGLDVSIIKSDIKHSELIVSGFCPYGSAIIRHNQPLIAHMCTSYIYGLTRAVYEDMDFKWAKMMCKGDDECHAVLTTDDPKDDRVPGGIRVWLLPLVSRLINRNTFVVMALSSFLFAMGERIVEIVGPDAAMVPARSARNAGVMDYEIFRSDMYLGNDFNDYASFIKEVRETVGGKVKISDQEIITTKCPLTKCGETESEFIKATCISYTEGLLSSFGDYEVVNTQEGGCHNRKICRQVIKKREEKEIENKEVYEAILDELVDAKTITASAIVTTTGLPVVSKMEKDVDEKLFAELSATMIGAGGTAINELKTGTSDRVILESSEARVVIIRAGREMLLVAMSHLETKLGLALLRIGRAVEKIKGVG